MEKEEIRLILESQRKFFSTGKTLDVNYRLETLKKLKGLIIRHEQEIKDALWKDLHKPECEVISSELNFVLVELNLAIKKVRRWTRPKRIRTPLIHVIARSYIAPQPYGNCCR
jgi:aldehyde dehydrogenase (NAD+)